MKNYVLYRSQSGRNNDGVQHVANGLMIQYIGVPMGEKLKVQKLVLAS